MASPSISSFSATSTLYATTLLLPRQVQRALRQQSVTIVHLDDVPIGAQFPALPHPNVLLAGVLRETPLEALEDLLSSGELELAPTDRLDDVGLGRVLPANGEEDLSDGHARGDADGLAVRVSHARREAIGTGATQHLVRADDVEGMDAHANVIRVLPHGVREMLVDGDAARLKGLARYLLLLVAYQIPDASRRGRGRRGPSWPRRRRS